MCLPLVALVLCRRGSAVPTVSHPFSFPVSLLLLTPGLCDLPRDSTLLSRPCAHLAPPSACRVDRLAPCAPTCISVCGRDCPLGVECKCQPLPTWSAVSGDTLLSNLRVSVCRGGCACEASAPSLTTCRPDPAWSPFLPSRNHCQTDVGRPAVLDCPPELSSISAPQRPAPSKVAQLRGGCRFGSSRFSSQSEHKFKEEIPSPTGESFSPGRSSNPTARVQVSAPL